MLPEIKKNQKEKMSTKNNRSDYFQKYPFSNGIDIAGSTLTISRADRSIRKIEKTFTEKSSLTKKDFRIPERKVEITKKSFFKRLFLFTEQELDGDKNRFSVRELIGEGGASQVFSVKDHNFNREIAIKLLIPSPMEFREEIESFVKEAKITASLEHPNIIPVHDLDVDEDGKVYLCMRKIKGHSLKRYIRDARQGLKHPQIKTADDIVRIFLKLCDALSFAHSKGIIHQDIKPDNIMIEEFGEVFLIDWSASSPQEDELSLTPVYMSPEQAMSKSPDERSDIYCLGAAFFHVLTLRVPTLAETLEELWEKKCEGIIDELTEKERAGIPQQLLAIALKAMQADTEKRYPTVEDFAQDLKNYQAGHAVSAYRDTLTGFLYRWYKRHTPAFWSMLSIFTVLAISAYFFYHLKLKEIAYWGKPVVVEKFENENWKKNWVVQNELCEIRKGRLVTKPCHDFNMFYKHKFYGSTALEFEGEMLPGSPPCDLSIFWCGDIVWDKDKKNASSFKDLYYFQTGARNNSYAIIQKYPYPLDYNNVTLKEGIVYKVRAEIDNKNLSLYLDGKKICSYQETFPLTSGYIGIYGFYEGKAFDNIKIYSKGVAEKVKVTNIGDAFFQKEAYKDAVEQYEKVIKSHEKGKIGQEALYKQGLCYYMMDNKEKAYSLWKKLQDITLRNEAQYYFWERLYNRNEHDKILSEMEKLYLKGNSTSKKQIEDSWMKLTSKCLEDKKLNYLPKYLPLQKKLFPHSIIHDLLVVEALIAIGRAEQVLEKYSDLNCAYSLMLLGRPEEVLEKYPDLEFYCGNALIQLGRLEELLKNYPEERNWCANALLRLGRPEEVLKNYAGLNMYCADALIQLGRLEEVLEKYPDIKDRCAKSLILLGRAGEVLKKYPDETFWRAVALISLDRAEEALNQELKTVEQEMFLAAYYIALKNYMGERRDEAISSFSSLKDSPVYYYEYFMFPRFLMIPFLKFIDNGQSADFKEEYQTIIRKHPNNFSQRLRYNASYILGEISDDEFLSQPYKTYSKADLVLCKAMKSEYMKNNKALDYYKQYKMLPAYKKELNPVIDLFVAWRIKELNKSRQEKK